MNSNRISGQVRLNAAGKLELGASVVSVSTRTRWGRRKPLVSTSSWREEEINETDQGSVCFLCSSPNNFPVGRNPESLYFLGHYYMSGSVLDQWRKQTENISMENFVSGPWAGQWLKDIKWGKLHFYRVKLMRKSTNYAVRWFGCSKCRRNLRIYILNEASNMGMCMYCIYYILNYFSFFKVLPFRW